MARKSKKKQVGKPSVSEKANIAVQSRELQSIQEAIRRGDLLVANQLANEFTRQNANSSQGWEMLANIQEQQQDVIAACQSMQRALECAREKNPLSVVKLAQYELMAGNANKAIERLKSLSQTAPKEKNVWVVLSRAYHMLGLNKEALEANDAAFALDDNYPAMLMLRMRIMDQLKRHNEAFSAAKKLKEISPNQYGVSNYLATLSLREGDYKAAEKYFNEELELDVNGEAAYNSFIAKHYNPDYAAEELTEIAKKWQEKYLKDIAVKKSATLTRKSKRIRIGFLSGGFRRHPVGQMILPALQNINKNEVELFFYTTNQIVDYLTLEIKEIADSWNSVSELNDEQFNQKIRHDSIDILIDMNGGGEGSKFTTLAKKPAPLIVKWVGILINTTGLKCFDYLLSDSVETPNNVDHLYTEKLIRMPDDYVCYHLPTYIPKVSSLPALKKQFITFGCLNNPAKLSGALIQEWAKLLRDVPNSKLLLRGIQFEGDDFCKRTLSRFAECGIQADRLLLEGPGKHEEFLKTYQRIDIALDTWPYSGGLTTCEALAMGVPVVTCVGPTFAGRHSATHLANAGLPELVTDNWDDFRKRVKELAADLPSLAVIRAALRTILTESPVCDGERFAKHFTKAMRGIWQRHCEGKAPEALTFNKEGDAWFADEDQVIELVEVEAEPEPQEAEFEWNLESPITVIDNGALFARHPKFTEWMQTGNFAVITFDPGSLLTKQADDLKQYGEWHHYPHATLGDGHDATLYATLDPELTGTLKPLKERETGDQADPLKVLSMLPISTVSLDEIEGIPHVDLLYLDHLNDAVAILENGSFVTENAHFICISIAEKLTHSKQLSLSDVCEWAASHCYEVLPLYKKNEANGAYKHQSPGVCFQALLVQRKAYKEHAAGVSDNKIKAVFDFFEIDVHAQEVLGCGFGESLLESSSLSRVIYVKYPLIYGVDLFKKGFLLGCEKLNTKLKIVDRNHEILQEIVNSKNSDLIFTGHSFYNLTIKSQPYINEEVNVFDLFNRMPFANIDDHAYADFMLNRCKNAPKKIIMGSSSEILLDEFEAISNAQSVFKIKTPLKIPAKDQIPFGDKKNRAIFVGKLYENVDATLSRLKDRIRKEKRITLVEKKLIAEMLDRRVTDPFYSPKAEKLNVSNLCLLYYDLIDKFFRNYHREKELEKVVAAFSLQKVPFYIVGGKKESWAFEGKSYCKFYDKMNYLDALDLMHASRYIVNLTPSYPDSLPKRALDAMCSNSLCITDYTPFYEQLNIENFYYDSKFIHESNLNETDIEKIAALQKDCILEICNEDVVTQQWSSIIKKAHALAVREG